MIDIKDIVLEGGTSTATSSGPISTDELNAQMEEALELLKEEVPEYTKSSVVPKGQAYLIDPNELVGISFWGMQRKTVVLNPEDYDEMFPEESED